MEQTRIFMKRFLITAIMSLFIIGLQAQTTTEKWNPVHQRWEYYDSNRNLVGYRKQNIYGQWVYTDVQRQEQQRRNEPLKAYDMDLIQKGLEIKQQRFNQKLDAVYEIISKIDYESSLWADIIKNNSITMSTEQANYVTKYYSTEISYQQIDKNYYDVVRYLTQVYNNFYTWRINASNQTNTQNKQPKPTVPTTASKTEKYPPGLYAVSKGAIINQNPDNNSKILLQMSDGGTVRVIDKVQNTAFYKVEADGIIGYMWVVGFKN